MWRNALGTRRPFPPHLSWSFLSPGCFTAVVPSIPFYLQRLSAPPSFMGLVVSAYSVGQIIGSTCIAGWLNDKLDSKTLLTLTSTSGIVATLFYVIGANHWFVLLSRWLTGVSAGWEFTTELSFIASNTSAKERTVFLSSVTAVNLVGFILGPALSTLLSMLNFEFMGLEINEYTGPGWLLVVLFVADFTMIRVFFKESTSSLSDERSKLLMNGEKEKHYGTIDTDKEIDRVERQVVTEQRIPSLLVVGGLIFIQFSLMCVWSVIETIASILAGDLFGWHIHECNVLFIWGGVASLLAYVSFVFASKRMEDRLLIAYAIVACIFGLLMMIAWSSSLPLPSYLSRFVAGYLIVNMGFMTGRPVTFSLYSKLTPEKSQGAYLGYMVAGGSFARATGPFVAVFVYYHIGKGRNTLVLFGSIATIMMTCLAVMLTLWSSLIPASDKEKSSGGKVSSHHSEGLSMHVDRANDNVTK